MNSTADIKSEVDNLRDILVRKDRRIELLEGLLAQANALKFGSSSEKLPAGEQGALFNESAEACYIEPQLALNDIVVPEHKRRKKKRISIPR